MRPSVLAATVMLAVGLMAAPAAAKPAVSCARSTSAKCRPAKPSELRTGQAAVDTVIGCSTITLIVEQSGLGRAPDQVSLGDAISSLSTGHKHGPLPPRGLLKAATTATTGAAQLVAVDGLNRWCLSHKRAA